VFNGLTEFLTNWAHLSGPHGKDKKIVPANFIKNTSINCIFFGRILSSLLQIRSLQLRKNAFSGELRPAGRVPSGATVDLSHNALSGRVPPELATDDPQV
jgi:hypothetical protein